MAEHPDVKIYVMGGSSGYGIEAVLSGKIDIGCVSRKLTDQERAEYCRFRYPPLVLTPIARDSIVLITYLGNPIDGLTKEEVKDIYAGRIKNWKELGGEDKKIILIGRIKDSGTKDVFKGNIMGGKKLTGEIIERSSNDAVMDTVFTNKGAIGYISLGHVDPKKVEVLALSRIKPSIESISNGSYPIVRTLYIITKGEPKGLERDFIDFILSKKGQRIIEEGGFVSI
ncbi:MAG: PBP superfamily domain protein [Candidatus Methanolliviera sp. GoM_asphalt]|nr:MAG: PBP superfamily domain protein [Candidatus Methanolliviera sp. GoM_asphalt]